MNKELELRMYGLVPYNLSEIQKAIQFGHAVVEYGQAIKGIPLLESVYNDWANNHKTFIILNGGTTNIKLSRLGTLNQHYLDLDLQGIPFASFHEPDLGDQLTALAFIVDERVFNKKLYPDFEMPNTELLSEQEKIAIYADGYLEWVKSIGGDKNLFLRKFLKDFRLA